MGTAFAGSPEIQKRVAGKPEGAIIMSVISMKQLLEAGVHFGHQTRRWNPKMAEYIFTERNGIYIIDLQKTVKKVRRSVYVRPRRIAAEGGSVLFVGTKKQAADAIHEEARALRYVLCQRQMARRYAHQLQDHQEVYRKTHVLLTKMQEDGTFDLLPKKEVAALQKEMFNLEKNLGGIKNMKGLPSAMFVVDPKKGTQRRSRSKEARHSRLLLS